MLLSACGSMQSTNELPGGGMPLRAQLLNACACLAQALWLQACGRPDFVSATLSCPERCIADSRRQRFYCQDLPGAECLDCFQLVWGLRHVAIASFSSVQIFCVVDALPDRPARTTVLQPVCHMRMSPTTHSMCPAFSPCGGWLAFCSDIPGSGAHLLVSAADQLPEHLSSMSAVARTPRAHALPLELAFRTEELSLTWLPCNAGVCVQRFVFPPVDAPSLFRNTVQFAHATTLVCFVPGNVRRST